MDNELVMNYETVMNDDVVMNYKFVPTVAYDK